MHRRVATGGPTVAHADVAGMVDISDIHLPGSDALAGNLRVATEAQVHIGLSEQLRIDRTVRVMASRTAFAQRRVLKYKRPGLPLMTLGAGFM
jgi:hypothetical protein